MKLTSIRVDWYRQSNAFSASKIERIARPCAGQVTGALFKTTSVWMILSQLPSLRYTITKRFYSNNKEQIVVVKHVYQACLEVDWGEVKIGSRIFQISFERRETEGWRKKTPPPPQKKQKFHIPPRKRRGRSVQVKMGSFTYI